MSTTNRIHPRPPVREAEDLLRAITDHEDRASRGIHGEDLLRAMDRLTEAALELCRAMEEYAVNAAAINAKR